MENRHQQRNFVYEVEVSGESHNEEFSLELFEELGAPESFKKIRTFDELLIWNDQLDTDS
ncbi:hypothetical protein ACFSCX_10865 [Bacillus salitolerans]|uniref:Uncharacterized protein n=1 Tax=Bacillus salitolerans TaxID=1437434 RepID=A0ABW4LRB9_9BACI